MVALREHVDDRRDVYVSRWSDDASAWSALGGPVVVTVERVPEPFASLEPTLLLDPFGTLLMASSVVDGNDAPAVLHAFDPSSGSWAWQRYAFGLGPGASRSAALAVGGDGRTFLAHVQSVSGADNPVFVGSRAVGATAWTILGGGSPVTPGWSARPTADLALAPDGTVAVAWIESAGLALGRLRLARLDDGLGAARPAAARAVRGAQRDPSRPPARPRGGSDRGLPSCQRQP